MGKLSRHCTCGIPMCVSLVNISHASLQVQPNNKHRPDMALEPPLQVCRLPSRKTRHYRQHVPCLSDKKNTLSKSIGLPFQHSKTYLKSPNISFFWSYQHVANEQSISEGFTEVFQSSDAWRITFQPSWIFVYPPSSLVVFDHITSKMVPEPLLKAPLIFETLLFI